jgi:hypothetical protein
LELSTWLGGDEIGINIDEVDVAPTGAAWVNSAGTLGRRQEIPSETNAGAIQSAHSSDQQTNLISEPLKIEIEQSED